VVRLKNGHKNSLFQAWKDAEELAVSVGCSSNDVVIAFFNKIAVDRRVWERD